MFLGLSLGFKGSGCGWPGPFFVPTSGLNRHDVEGTKAEKSPDTTPGSFNTLLNLFRRGHNAQRQKSSRLGILVMSPVLGTGRKILVRLPAGGKDGNLIYDINQTRSD